MKNKNNKLTLILKIICCTATSNYLIKKFNKNKLPNDNTELMYKSILGQISYKIYGENNKKNLLLLHSLTPGANKIEWENNVLKLSKHYKIYVIDLIGFGRSSKPKSTYSSYFFVILINEFIKNVIKDKTYAIGNLNTSNLLFVAQNINPENFYKTILINPVWKKKQSKFKILLNRSLKHSLELPLFGTLLSNIFTSPFFIEHYYKNKLLQSQNLEKHFKHISNITSNSEYGNDNTKFLISALLTDFFHIPLNEKKLFTNKQTKIFIGEFNTQIIYYNLEIYKPIIIKDGKLQPQIENHDLFNEEVLKYFN